jgi:transposase-like protein
MKNAQHHWSNHVTAIRSQGVTTSAYARQHGLSVASLYYWQRKLQSATTTLTTTETAAAPRHPSKFVALRINDSATAHAERRD